jgi:DNA topoisomerase-1
MKLVIVESPGKLNKIGQYLGPDYIVKASFGHCIDLDKKTLSIDVDNNYKPNYVICEGKEKIVKELLKLKEECTEVILASDEDREGEAIAWTLSTILKLKDPNRIVFHEITKKAIMKAIENPRKIDMNMVHAQQARRLLDRLVGYKISPLLWNFINTNTVQSAGRVQSVVVNIINDKEKDIINSKQTMFYKTSVEFKKKIISYLKTSDNNYYKESTIDLLNNINSGTIFKVNDIENKEGIKKAAPPFITSSLQQEASTKLKFSVKKTMEVAQKLYESGLITYMRTDSTLLSEDCRNDCKKYIIENFGQEYSRPFNYTSKNSTAQEAHEAIRPTNINNKEISFAPDGEKLYSLIWHRTIASQMANAKLAIQIIKIDCINDKSLLTKYTSYFVTETEVIIFDGFLKVYKIEDSEEEKISKKLELKKDQILTMEKVKMVEEFNKLPLRFNEANLVKFLEKNNIGRPSTYASIISKIIERNYVEIKDIDGEKKEIKIVELNNKYKLSESKKEIVIGKENKKLVPTELGIKINDFMITNFENIMKIDFTSEFENFLDKIALGEAKWFNILDKFYKSFQPMVDKLKMEKKAEKQDLLLGINPINQNEIFVGTGKYGPYLKMDGKYTSILSTDILLEDALEVLEYPKKVGLHNSKKIYLCNGKFGLYLKYNDKNYSVKIPEEQITLDYAINLIESGDTTAIKSFKIGKNIINLKNGKYGHYLQLNKKNYPIPIKYKIENLSLENILEIIGKK